MIDDSLYEEVKSTTITSFNDTGPDFLIDNAVPPANDLVGVFTSSPQIYPWFEIKLDKTVKIMGVEMTHPDWSSNNFVSKNIQFRAGLSPAPNLQQDTELTSRLNWSILQNKNCFTFPGLLTDTSNLLAEYWPEIPPTAGEVTYITFSEPVDAKYLFVQADWSTAETQTKTQKKTITGTYSKANTDTKIASILTVFKKMESDDYTTSDGLPAKMHSC